MSAFYNNLTQTASKLLKSYGHEFKFTRTVPGAYDPTIAGHTTSSTVTYKGYGAILNYKTTEIDGTSILSGDLKLLLEQTKKRPEVNDITLVDTVPYLVMAVKETRPAGVTVVTECQLRIGESQ